MPAYTLAETAVINEKGNGIFNVSEPIGLIY